MTIESDRCQSFGRLGETYYPCSGRAGHPGMHFLAEPDYQTPRLRWLYDDGEGQWTGEEDEL